MKKILFFLLLVAVSLSTNAQTREVSGIVQDSSGTSVIAASVKLVTGKDTLKTATNADGIFIFKSVPASQFVITVTSLGYKTINKRFLFAEGTSRLVLDPLIMGTSANELQTVTVSGTRGITIKEDTVEYKASDYQLRENAVTEDLLKRLPGIEVDKDGNVTAQGKQVTKVRVNGKDFFGGDVKTATQQLPADIIDKIQIVDDYGDQANLTGIKDGDPDKILNIQVRKDKNNGYFANGSAGYGNEDRYRLTGNGNYFKDTQQISFLGNLNNTNTSLFSFSGGSSSGGSGRSSGGSSRGGSSFSGGSSRGGSFGGSSFGGSDGLTDVASIGLNYRDDLSKKVTTYGSYSYSYRDNNVSSLINQQIVTAANPRLDIQNNFTNAISQNHRFDYNLEYRIDSLNYLKVNPNFSYSKSNSTLNSLLSSFTNGTVNPSLSGNQNTFSRNETPNFGGNILYNHRFSKKGRNFSIEGNLSRNNTDQDFDNTYITNNFLRTDQNTMSNSVNTSAQLSYIEPLSNTKSLEFEYRIANVDYDNERITNNISQSGNTVFDPGKSNNYNYSFLTNRFGLNYRVNEKKYNYSLGLRLQPTLLTGESITLNTSYRNTGLNLIPVARYSYNFSRTKSFNVNYFGRSNEPSYQQVLPVTDFSDARYPVTGNPDLNAEFTHSLSVRYNNFNFETGDILFTNISANVTQDKIVTNTLTSTAPGVIQETRYTNANGYYTLNGFYAYSKPFAEKKYVLSFRGLANYNNNLTFTDNQRNEGKNIILSQGLNMQINPNRNFEINPGVRYTYNKTDYTLTSQLNTTVSAWAMTWNSRMYFLKTFIFGVDFDKTINKGYEGSLNQSPFIINTYLEKQFFKKKNGTVRFQAFDLLDESTSISRVVTNNIITDSRSNRLSRYFMLSFTMRLQKFGGQMQTPDAPGNGPVIIHRERN